MQKYKIADIQKTEKVAKQMKHFDYRNGGAEVNE